ncbi:MAG: hypothetical protein AAGD13_17295 [Pseudomonadota bacterium]
MNKIITTTAVMAAIILGLFGSVQVVAADPVQQFFGHAFDTGLPLVMTGLAALMLLGTLNQRLTRRRIPNV